MHGERRKKEKEGEEGDEAEKLILQRERSMMKVLATSFSSSANH